MKTSDVNSKELLMGIDIGSTSVKCALYNRNAELEFLATQPTTTAYQLGSNLNVERLWEITLQVCAEAVGQAKSGKPINVCGIAVSGIGCIPVLLDAQEIPIVVDVNYEDRMKAFIQFSEKMTPDNFKKITGYPMEFLNSGFLLAAMRPAEKARIKNVLSVSDFINFKLTGIIKRDFSTALSMATWDYLKNSWWNDFIKEIGLDPDAFGNPVESALPVGPLLDNVAKIIGIPKKTMVYTGGHDYLCAALASNIIPCKEVLNVAGTVEIMASLFKDSDLLLEDGSIRSKKDHHIIPWHYSYMIEAPGAGQVEWLRNNILAKPGAGPENIPKLEPYFEGLSGLPPAFSQTRELFIPQIYGRLLPKSNMQLTGAYLGLNFMSTGLSVFKATIEGLCFQAKLMYEKQKEVLKNQNVKFKSVGGGSRNTIWNQIKANILDTTIHIPNVKEASALGAALLAGIGAGIYKDFNEAGSIAEALGEEVIMPVPRVSAMYQEIFEDVYLPSVNALETIDYKIMGIINKYSE